MGLWSQISSCFAKNSFAACSCDERGQAIDEGARQILGAIEEAGKEGYIVGGCVRDELMGIEPKDWDVEVYGVQPEKSRTVPVKDSMGMLETYAEVDKALADLNGNSAA